MVNSADPSWELQVKEGKQVHIYHPAENSTQMDQAALFLNLLDHQFLNSFDKYFHYFF